MTATQRAVAAYTTFLSKNEVCVSHGLGHSLKVLSNCQQAIAAHLQGLSEYTNVQKQLLESCQLAALLHDADDKKLFPKSTDNRNAREIMNEVGVSPESIDAAIQMIELVSFSKNGEKESALVNPLYYYPRHADRLEATGFIGIIRCYQYATTAKNPLYCQTTPVVHSRSDIEEVIKGRDVKYMISGGSSDSFIDHFYDKLLHVKCPQSAAANPFFREEYARRKGELEEFVLEASRTNFSEIDRQVQELMKAHC